MTQHIITEIAVLGAGVVGLSVAERLLAQGHGVVLVDPAWTERFMDLCQEIVDRRVNS